MKVKKQVETTSDSQNHWKFHLLTSWKLQHSKTMMAIQQKLFFKQQKLY